MVIQAVGTDLKDACRHSVPELRPAGKLTVRPLGH